MIGRLVEPPRATGPAIDQLHERYAGPLYLFAWRRLGDRRLAEEVVQDTLVRAWRHAGRFDPDRGALSAWVFTIARNLVNDELRRRQRRPREVALLDGADGPTDDDVDRVVEAWQLADALRQLSDDHRRAIVEVHYLGFSVRDVAARHGVPVGTVKSRLYYGLRSLRLLLEEKGTTR